MKITRDQLKSIVENVMQEASGADSLAIACYSNSDFVGKAANAVLRKVGFDAEKDEYGNPKGWYTSYLPQGHAWVILINGKTKEALLCNFGSRSCDLKTGSYLKKAMIYLGKKGIPFLSANRVQKTSLGKANYKRGKISAKEVDRLIKKSVSKIGSIKRKVSFVIFKGVNFESASKRAGEDGSCKPYNIIPMEVLPPFVTTAAEMLWYDMSDFQFENCGSYVMEVIGAGQPAFKKSGSELSQFAVTPGMIIELGKSLGVGEKLNLNNGYYA